MKRQALIIGPTPEFVRWSLRQGCPLRADTDLASIDQTEKRLRAVQIAGGARQREVVIDGLALREDPEAGLQAIRLADVFDIHGGIDSVSRDCQRCPANVPLISQSSGGLAGCCGWLESSSDEELWHSEMEACWPDQDPPAVLPTRPRWYGFWTSGPWESGRLEFAIGLFTRMANRPSRIQSAAARFLKVLETARQQQLILDAELIPAGHSDGIHWTVQRHCDACQAGFEEAQSACRVCGKPGRGHPPVKRRVLGHRPWIQLDWLVDGDTTRRLRQQFVRHSGPADDEPARPAPDGC